MLTLGIVMKHFKKLLCMVSLAATLPVFLCAREINWDWTQIDPTVVSFPKNFLWGCADSALQTEGIVTAGGKTIENSWTVYEKSEGKVQVGVACERWTRYKEDFALTKDLGMNAHRFSVDWSKIEPEEGKFDQEAMQHYVDMVDELVSLGLKPMITVFHHAAPLWFMHKKGFEDEKNIAYFVRFARYVFNHLHEKVPFWIIFNEPIAYAFEGYFRGRYPPGKNSLTLAGKVTLNQLNAHVAAAQEFRRINRNAKIGIAHMSHPIDAFTKWNLFEKSVSKLFSYLMNETTITFFKTGKFKWVSPWIWATNEQAPGALDFFGVNYYTHTTLKQIHPFRMEAMTRPEEKVVDASDKAERSKVMYPEGLYRSIVRASKLNIPIYITENGAATDDPALKTEYLQKHLYVISRAISEGYDIRGYFFWTLVDCYSWNKGYGNKHGLYAVDFATQERTFRPANQYLIDIIQRFS